jgi:hypothetical protein
MGFIERQIATVKSLKEIDELKIHLLRIGDSQMDLYYGKYSPTEISDQIINSIKRKKISSENHYDGWLKNEGKEYKLFKLKDKSIWTLRLGETRERYIHIHPARYSPHTIRVKATALKTVILILCLESLGELKDIDTEPVNIIRKKYLNEPPLKSLSKTSGFMRLLDRFH